MPGPDTWSPEDFQSAQQLLGQRGKGGLSADQVSTLSDAVGYYKMMHKLPEDAGDDPGQTGSPERIPPEQGGAAGGPAPAPAEGDRLPGETPEHYSFRKEQERRHKHAGEAMPEVADTTQPLSAFMTMLAHGWSGNANDEAAAGGAEAFNRDQALRAGAEPNPLPGVAAFAGLPSGQLPALSKEDLRSLPLEQGPTHLTQGIEGTDTGQTSAGAERAAVNEQIAKANKDSPKMALAGELVGAGMASVPAVEFMGALPGMAALGNVTRGVVQGGVLGSGFGAAEAEPGQRMEGAKRGGATGAMIGGAVPAAFGAMAMPFTAAGVRNPAEWLFDTLEGTASEQRGLSSGPTSGQIDAMKEMKGPGAVADLGRNMEESGFGGPGSPGITPKSYQGTEEAAHAAMTEVGQKVQALATQADQQGITVDMRPVAMAMEDEAVRLKGLGLPEADRAADALRAKVDTIIGNTAKKIPPNQDRPYLDAWDYRKFLDAMAFDAEGQKAGVDAKRLRMIAGEARQAMRDAVGSDPKLAAAVESTNKEYETASRVYENARKGASHELGSDNPESPTISKGRKRAVAARGLREAQGVARAVPDYAPAATGAMMGTMPPWLFDQNQSQEQNR